MRSATQISRQPLLARQFEPRIVKLVYTECLVWILTTVNDVRGLMIVILTAADDSRSGVPGGQGFKHILDHHSAISLNV